MVIVISVGGSAINPGKIQYKFLKSLKKVIQKFSKKEKIVIVAGGGFLARDYISTLAKENFDHHQQDLIGIECTRLNAKLLSMVLKANKNIPTSLDQVKSLMKKNQVVVCGGLGPGQTSDGTTASIAKILRAKTLINMTNVKGLHDKNPLKYEDAKFIRRISHEDFKKMVEKIKEKPGQHFVLDSYAANICRKEKINVIILKGVRQLENYLSGKKFVGTLIS